VQKPREALALVDARRAPGRCGWASTFVVVSGLGWVAAINAGGREQARVKEVRSEPIMGMMPLTA